MTAAFRPASIAEALRILGDPGRGAVAIAGGTDLLVPGAPALRRPPDAVVDLLGVAELQGIRVAGGCLDIGAACTFTRIRRDPEVRERLPALAAVAATIGGWQIQNRATIGGNIANASPAGDSLPVLLALGARLLLHGPSGVRAVDYEGFHTGYRRTALAAGEIIARVLVPLPGDGAVALFRKVGTREAQAISKIVVAFAARREGGVLRDVRVAAGSVAPVPVRLRAAEAALEGRPPSVEHATAAGDAARNEVNPIEDVRSTARWRRFALGNVVRRLALATAAPPGGKG